MANQPVLNSVESDTNQEPLWLDEAFKEVVENAYMAICFIENEKVIYANIAFRKLFENVGMDAW